MPNNTDHEYDIKRNNKGVLKRFFYFLQGKVSLKQFQNPFVFRSSLYPVKRVLSGYKIPFVVCAVLVLSLYIPVALVVANPGVHVQVPQSPLAPNQPVYIEFFTDPGEDGTIQLDITKPPLLAIFWQSGPIPISGGILYDVTAPGFTDPGTYVVSAYVTLSGGGGNLYSSTTFEVVAGGQPGGQPGFDYNLEVEPPVTEIGQGEIAHFQVIVIYSNPAYSGTMVSINLTGLGPGMQWHPEPGGHISISTSHETPPGTYHIDIIGEAQGIVRQTVATLIVRGGEEEPPPEEPPPEEHPEEPPPEEHPEEPPPEEHPEEPPPEEHPEEPPPEEHPPEHPDEYPPEQWEPERWEGEQHEESTVTELLSNPLYLIIIALMVIIVLLIVALMRRS